MGATDPKQLLMRQMIAKGLSPQVADIASNECFDYVRQIREKIVIEDAKHLSVRKAGRIMGLSKSAIDKIRHSKKRKRPELPGVQLEIKFKYFNSCELQRVRKKSQSKC